ncbi:MAG: sodium-dependent transporter [Bacteroidaceae bacterium]|nr:sodium-dependent transporter [Bacteroidaceae bacterium]
MEKRKNFSSKLGIVLASAGSAVGLGNVWRFPTEVGEGGGAAFILVYVLCVVLLGLPLMVSEFIIGRYTHKNTADAYRQLAPRSGWIAQGYLGVFTSWFILCYYSVVAGWTMKYLVEAIVGGLSEISDSSAYFAAFSGSTWEPLVYMTVVMLLCHLVIIRGVQSGIERSSKLMMPLLLLIIAMLVVFSFSMPGSSAGLTFLLKPDLSKLTSSVILSAMGQAFFSLSIAMGCLCTYASYFTDDARLVKTAGSVAAIDTTVAIMSGFIMFPAVFSVEAVTPDAGPGLVFITLPHVFSIAFGNVPLLGWFFSVMFYLLLLLAALTSMVSIHEPPTAFLLEHFKLSRPVATTIVTVVCLCVGVLCCLSFGPLADCRPLFGLTFFDFFDFVSAKIFLPLGGIIISLFVGWRLDRDIVVSQLTNNGSLHIPAWFIAAFIFLLRWLIPLAVGGIFIRELGLI